MRYLLTVLLGFLLSILLICPDAKANEISYVINELSPHLSEKKALEYAIIIDKYSKQYDVSWKIIVAILKQESDFIHGEISEDFRDFGI
ncbi:MAG: hypothetical protein R3213_08500, partial [Flavobacteriaceae bacterium]|nr:hypothetical protein [Flavobacteriaceae bacterium]